MKNVILQRQTASAYHDPDLAIQGQIIRSRLETTNLPRHSPLLVIKASFSLPAGRPFYEALHSCKPSGLCNTNAFLSIQSPPKRSRHWIKHSILVPNFLLAQRVPRQATKEFLRMSKSDLAALISILCGGYITWKKVCDSLESSLIGTSFSPALVRYTNFVETYAGII